MKIQVTYLATVTVAVLLLFIGHNIVVQDRFVFQDGMHQEVTRAKVHKIVERIQVGANFDWFDEFSPMLGEKIIFEARVTSGVRRGEIITAEQSLSSLFQGALREVSKGDSILLININDEWFFNGHSRTNKLLALGIIFTLCVLFFGGKKGFNAILSLGLTFGAIFAVFIPSILSGKNIYVMAMLVCIYTTIMTFTIVVGLNKKSLSATIGCISGILVTGLITLIMDRVLFLTGIIDEHSRFLMTLPVDNPLNLRAIVFAGIIIGAMGAIMDVAMSISSALWELKEKAKVIKFETLFRSGLNIGRDIFGTMANTLILAYIGTSLSVVLLLGVYSDSLLVLFNSEMIVVEVLQALAGSFGILLAMPLTAFFCAVFYSPAKCGARAACTHMTERRGG
ncbi:MAG: YibE/F family protein [Spirochaetes bacterium]|nr:YibE/F family protein [Spirochaetota bacterium]